MDIFVLDSSLRRTALIDSYESFIWTERWTEIGDFELVLPSTYEMRKLLTVGKRLVINESLRVMVIETAEDKDDSEGRSMLTLSGRSLESILEDRIAHHEFYPLDTHPRWWLKGTPGYLARAVFKEICVNGLLDLQDRIPFITEGTLIPNGNLPESDIVVELEAELQTLYALIQQLCTGNGLGFALVRNGDTSQLYFDVFTGSDRTGRQSSKPPVIFSPEMDTLANASQLTSIATHKTVAYVFSDRASMIVYPVGVDPEMPGFERRVLLVKVDNVRDNTAEANLSTEAILRRRGREALAAHRKIDSFDGEIPTTGYRYGTDYNLGDIVEMRKSDDIIKYMRVTEQIFISDAEGDRSYPTLSLDHYHNVYHFV